MGSLASRVTLTWGGGRLVCAVCAAPLALATGCSGLLALDDLTYAPDASADAISLQDGSVTAPPDGPATGLQDGSVGTLQDGSATAPPDGPATAPTDGPATAPTDGPATAPTDGSADAIAAADGGVITLVSGQPALGALTLDGTNLYWVGAPGTDNGVIETAPKSGASTPTPIAQMQMQPLDIAVDDQNVYWSVNETPGGGNGSVCNGMFASKAGGADAACITRSQYPTLRMTTDTHNVVFVTQAGGGGYNPAQRVGYAQTGSLPLAPFQSRPTQGPASAVAATDSYIFVSDGMQNPHIDTFTLQAGLPVDATLCGGGCGAVAVVDLIASSTNGFWVTSDGNVYTEPVAMTNLNGAKVGSIGENNVPNRMASDANFVYLTAGTGSIYALPIPGVGVGTKLITLASGQDQPFGIAVDSNNVYWTTADGYVRAIAVPTP